MELESGRLGFEPCRTSPTSPFLSGASGKGFWKRDRYTTSPINRLFVYLTSYPFIALLSATLPRSTPRSSLPVLYSLQHCYCILHLGAIKNDVSCLVYLQNHRLAQSVGSSQIYSCTLPLKFVAAQARPNTPLTMLKFVE